MLVHIYMHWRRPRRRWTGCFSPFASHQRIQYYTEMAASIITFSSLVIGALAAAEPAVTAAAVLEPRQIFYDPALVGYPSASGGCKSFAGNTEISFADASPDENGRTCDYPQVVSTSGSFAQCCPLSGACPFYTACSSNTLLGTSGRAVACDANPGLTCNTAILATTAGADGGASYLACWQSTLGSSAFTFVQDIGNSSEFLLGDLGCPYQLQANSL